MTSNHIYRLKNLGLPAMTSIDDFAFMTKLSLGQIKQLSYYSDLFYSVYSLPKVNGGRRIIAQPSRSLKAVQAWILRNILDKLRSSQYSKGFERGCSILDNAKPHIGANYILSIDLENFFPSIKASKVYGVFRSIGYNKEMSILLTNICVYDGSLPQGAPTSPKLANLICSNLDARIQGYAGPRGITYTRYADDITLSGQSASKIQRANQFINIIISGEELKINSSKTRLCGTRRQKKITGLILNENGVGIGREKLKELRAKLHYLYLGKNDNFDHVNGLLSFVSSVDRKMYNKLYVYIYKLNERFPDSQAREKIHSKINKVTL